MMKRKKILSLLLAAALAVLAALPCSAAHYEPFEHPDVSFSDVVYTGVDRAAADALCARFARDPLGEYDALVALYDELYTQCELAYVLLCENTDDAAYSAAYEQAENDFDYASDRLFLALSEALDGPEGYALRARMPEGGADAFSGYEAADGDELAALSEETALMQEYYLLPDDDAFPEAAAELYLRLTALRRAQAEEAGFDSYAEYAYQAHYAREYGPGDIARLRETVRERLAPLYVRCVRALDARRPPWDDDDVPSGDEILSALAAHMGEVSPELTEAMDFLLRSGFFCVGSGDELYDGGFTTTLPAYGAPFLFNRVSTRFDAFQSTVHEFGHFNAAYHDPTPALYQYAGTDLSELQAQGLEMLFLPCLQDILAGEDEADRAYVTLTALSTMLSSLIDGCLYDEFEQAVFADPDMTTEDLFALEMQLYRDYGLDAVYELEPFWPYIPHLFDQPFYYVSYAVSALPALDVWLRAQDDRAAATEAYLNVSAARTDAWFLDVVEENDLCDVTSRRDLARLADGLERELAPLLDEAADGAQTLSVWWIAATVVLGACVLLVWKRRQLDREAEEWL